MVFACSIPGIRGSSATCYRSSHYALSNQRCHEGMERATVRHNPFRHTVYLHLGVTLVDMFALHLDIVAVGGLVNELVENIPLWVRSHLDGVLTSVFFPPPNVFFAAYSSIQWCRANFEF